MLGRIRAREFNEKATDIEIQAAMKGQKIKIPRVGMVEEKPPALTPEQEKVADKAMAAAIKRKMQQIKGRAIG